MADISRYPNAGQEKNKSTQKNKSESEQQTHKSYEKNFGPCCVYVSPVHRSKEPNQLPSSFFCTAILCGRFYHQGWPDAPRDLIIVPKTKHVFVHPVTHERHSQINFVMFIFILTLNLFSHMIAAFYLNLSY